MDKIYNFFSSVKLGVYLLLVYAFVIALATFVENDFGTASANWLVYKSVWFNILNFLLLINMLIVFHRYRMIQIKKITIFLFHLGLLIVVVGAGITRFLSYEGVMHIREGKSSNLVISYETFLKIKIDDGDTRYEMSLPVNFNNLSEAKLDDEINFNNHNILFKVKDFIPNAAETIVESDNGGYILSFAISGKGGREDVYIKEGEEKVFSNTLFNFKNTIINNAINFLHTDSGLVIVPHMPLVVQNMTDTFVDVIAALKPAFVKKMKLYHWANQNMVISEIYENSETKIESQGNAQMYPLNALIINFKDGDNSETVNLFGKGSVIGKTAAFKMNGLNYEVSYGAATRELPFSLTLDKFELERYPGSKSPASYQSFISLVDSRTNLNQKHKIFMNNVLVHDGIRFYQSSYDQDEKGTILSVNKDSLGTWITYLGYILLSLGMFLNIFDKNSRFRKLNIKVKELTEKSTVSIALIMLFFMFSLSSSAQLPQINKAHADNFGKLLVQDHGGRIKPLNTLATEALLKLSRKSTYKELSANQVLLGMLFAPQEWANEPIIKIKNPTLIKKLKVKNNHIALANLFDSKSQYIIQKEVGEAYATAPGRQTKYDKAIIKLDEKVNVLYMLLNNDMLNIFPLKGDVANKWYSINDVQQKFKAEDSVFVTNVYRLYMNDIKFGVESNNWNKADSSLSFIRMYQEKAGADIIISDNKRDAEVFYNQSAIFRHLFEFYFIVGLVFLALLFAKLLFVKFKSKYIEYGFVGIIVTAFIIHTLGLALRWYIAEHAPWSNGYESMIYISWATMLAGILFSRTSKISLAATTILSGMILLVAHLSWIDPEITNLVPVLQSYWLTIHVAVITASYGFLALGAILAFLNLILMIIRKESNYKRISNKILQLTYINEMTLIAGLFLLTIGTFLGGVWANESWGRYWGWDSKETWALITVLVYAFILHMRFIPRLKSIFTFNLLSLLSYSTVMMTYFGVNYYLSGLHSYAKGDPVPIPMFVYYTYIVVVLMAILAYNKNYINDKKNLK